MAEEQKSKPFDPKANRKEDPRLGVGALDVAEFKYTQWDAKPAAGVSPEQVLAPEYWTHFAHRFTPGDLVFLHPDDATWTGQLYVIDCSRTWAKVKYILGPVMLVTHDANLTAEPSSSAEVEVYKAGYKIAHRGPRRWSVVRADGHVMHEDEQEKSGAEKWLDKYAREQLGAPKAPLEAPPETA